MLEQIYNLTEAAGILRISGTTLKKLAAKGAIQSVHLGIGTRRIHRGFTATQIQAYISNQNKARRERINDLAFSLAKSGRSTFSSGDYSAEALAARGLLCASTAQRKENHSDE